METKTLVVRRGLSSSYYFYLAVFAHENGIELIVDRRLGERRTQSSSLARERRGGDRRAERPAPDPAAGDLLHVSHA
jgi:hypothetical protein